MIVVGSGFGGSFVAHALADRRPRGAASSNAAGGGTRATSPADPTSCSGTCGHPASGRFGLFDFRAFRGLTALVGAGVGGGSLIYANVLLRKPDGVVHDPDRATSESVDWPISRRRPATRTTTAAITLLEPMTFDAIRHRSPRGRRRSSGPHAIGATRCSRPDLAVSVQRGRGRGSAESRSDGPTACTARACRLCGECILGCNYGAKNTLDLTVLRTTTQDRRPRAHARALDRPDRDDATGYAVRYIDLAGPSTRLAVGAARADSRDALPGARASPPARSARPS